MTPGFSNDDLDTPNKIRVEDLLPGGKRGLPDISSLEFLVDKPIKRCKQCDVKDYYDDWVAKKDEAKRAESLWRNARNKMYYIASIKSQN